MLRAVNYCHAAAPGTEVSKCSLKSRYLSKSISRLSMLKSAVPAVHRIFGLLGQMGRPAQTSQKR
jgi:hypothetical protein